MLNWFHQGQGPNHEAVNMFSVLRLKLWAEREIETAYTWHKARITFDNRGRIVVELIYYIG